MHAARCQSLAGPHPPNVMPWSRAASAAAARVRPTPPRGRRAKPAGWKQRPAAQRATAIDSDTISPLSPPSSSQ